MHLTVAFAYLCDEASLVTLKKKDFVIANASGSASVSINSVKAEPVNAIVFYHLFVKDLEDAAYKLFCADFSPNSSSVGVLFGFQELHGPGHEMILP